MKEFETKADAFDWLLEQDLDYMDNERFAYLDDPEQVAAYEDAREHGCCGYVDVDIIVGGRPAMIGCNYGH